MCNPVTTLLECTVPNLDISTPVVAAPLNIAYLPKRRLVGTRCHPDQRADVCESNEPPSWGFVRVKTRWSNFQLPARGSRELSIHELKPNRYEQWAILRRHPLGLEIGKHSVNPWLGPTATIRPLGAEPPGGRSSDCAPLVVGDTVWPFAERRWHVGDRSPGEGSTHRHQERSAMFGFRPGHQHLTWVALLAVPLLLAFMIGSPIPHPIFGPGAPTSATSHVGPLAEVAATGAWVAWGTGLAKQVRRHRRASPAQLRIKPSAPAAGTDRPAVAIRRAGAGEPPWTTRAPDPS